MEHNGKKNMFDFNAFHFAIMASDEVLLSFPSLLEKEMEKKRKENHE